MINERMISMLILKLVPLSEKGRRADDQHVDPQINSFKQVRPGLFMRFIHGRAQIIHNSRSEKDAIQKCAEVTRRR
jgi:hypothetical protein